MNAQPHRTGLAVVLLLLTAIELATAQRAPSGAKASVTLLVDLSYSMRLPLSLNKDDRKGPTRIEEAKRLIDALMRSGEANTEWSLLTFGGELSESEHKPVEVRLGFSRNTQELRNAVAGLETWGVSPVAKAVSYAELYSNRYASTANRTVLVISDGIDTTPTLFQMPTAASLRGGRSRILFAGIGLRDQPELARRLRDRVRGSGGAYVDVGDIAGVEAALAALTIPGAQSAVSPTGGGDRTEPASGITGRGPGVWWLILGLLVALVPIPLLVFSFRNRRRNAARRHALGLQRELVTANFVLEHRGGPESVVFDEFPAPLAVGDRARGKRGLPQVTIEGEGLRLSAKSPVLVNGVARRSVDVYPGDRIHGREGVWSFKGIRKEPIGPHVPKALRATGYYLVSSLLAVLLLGTSIAYIARLPSGSLQTAAPTTGPAVVKAPSRTEPQSTETALVGTDSVPRPFVHTVMIAPGSSPSYFKADVMFIHAHPDDESIDFGGLMALGARSGRRVVTVLFTDGTAGLDQFPNRRVGENYPDHPLGGGALASVRVQEAEAALSILGSREYVRLGLLNNPYDSIREILPLHEVLRRWGGEARVVSRLVALLEGFRPTIVVSPDKHHRGVFKHFEHEAVGYVTDEALSYLRSHGKDFVEGHLVAVDPMLTSQYAKVFGVNVMARDPRSGLTYRAIQLEALKQHVTQRDASVIGVEVVPNFADEYYAAQSWRLAMPPEEYLHASRSTGTKAPGVH